MNSKKRKIAVAALSVTMAATIAASQAIAYAAENRFQAAAPSGERTVEGTFNNLTGSLDLTDIARRNLSDKVVDYGEEAETQTISGSKNSNETLIISLDSPAISELTGEDVSVAEYLSSSAGRTALNNITASQNRLLGQLSSAGISYKVVDRYSTVINAVAVEVNTSQLKKINLMQGVGMIGVSKTYAAIKTVDAQINPSNVYGTGIYDSSEIIEDYGYDGKGVTVAILDTGLDYTHEAFSYAPKDPKFSESDIQRLLTEGNLHAQQRTPGVTSDQLYLSSKVPFAYDYSDSDTDVYPSYSQHGVHVAGIVAGKADTYIDKDGNKIDDKGSVTGEGYEGYDFLGVAPEAQLVICKVFTDDLDSEDLGGATSEDIIAALDDCVTLGVDIINMSLGTTSGFSNLDIEGDQEGQQLKTCYENIKNAGISLIAAAGNEFSAGFGSEFGTNLGSNPDSGTVGSPSTFVGAMSVASINGQQAPYLLANAEENGGTPIYYNESNDSNSVPFDFAEEMLGEKESETFTYLVIPGVGSAGDYAQARERLNNKAEGEKIIVVVRRGTTDFKEKVETAHYCGADGIIVYNNVPGTIRMSLGDIDPKQRIPAVSVDMDAGTALTMAPAGGLRTEGKIEINKKNLAGPFMNDYSSWGATPDLGLKPDITSHGGEITSAVSGGYEEMSGTSMATPNLAGLMALVKDYLKDTHQSISAKELTTLTNQIVMSSATLLYDEEGRPYSPRKQGAGLATLKNIFTTKAYLSTTEGQDGGTEDNRPKVELGEDEAKNGVYNFKFKIKNTDNKELKFKIISRFMTETISTDELAVAEAAYMLDDIPAQFEVSGATFDNVDLITVASGAEATISVKLTLSADEKNYIDRYFKNGMYVEGFISLESDESNGGQCDLNLPFMGFYGDWESAPLLDYNAYEISAIEQDTSLTEEQKPHESIFATQLYSTYYNGRYAVPMGGFAYLQDENADQIYVTEEHCSISRFNDFYGATSMENYLSSTGLRALYVGLLRNAELVTFDITNVNTGELVYQGTKYRLGKGYAGGGSARPGLVELKLDSDELGLVNNNKYNIEFKFYMKATDKDSGEFNPENSFKSDFYVDYDAPVLQGTRLRFYDYTEGKETKQRVYLDLDIYDNHYPQSVLLCYSDEDYDPNSDETPIINMATEYVTPIYNPERNTTNTVSIEITDIYEKYRNKLYVQVDDYSLNHSVFNINFPTANQASQTERDISFVTDGRLTETIQNGKPTYSLTIEKNEAYTIGLNCGSANPSNYTWKSSRPDRVNIKYNQIFGVKTGESTVTVTTRSGDNGEIPNTISLKVTVVDSTRKLPDPKLSFGPIVNSKLSLTNPGPGGTVLVNAGQTFTLDIEPDPWYYPVSDLNFTWSSSDEDIATVTQEGVVTTNNTRGTATITAEARQENGTPVRAVATLSVVDPFDAENMMLSHYYGSEETVVIPNDRNIMTIGEEAFEDNKTMKKVVIPKTVTQISERAFLNCTALEEVYFIEETDDDSEPVLDLADVNLILADAFMGCTNLKILDLTNVKVVTIGASAFANTPLEKIRHMEKIGIADDYAFRNCTKLQKADITGLHTVGYNIFEGCTQLNEVTTAHYSAIGEGMFYGCTSLEEITINNPRVSGSQRFGGEFGFGGGAFENCTSLQTVNFGGEDAWENTVFRIDAYAFRGCTQLSKVEFADNCNVSYIGDNAFANTAITSFEMPKGNPVLGDSIFGNNNVTITWGEGYDASETEGVYRGNTLLRAPATVTSDFKFKDGITEIAAYAFSESKFEGIDSLTIPETVTVIGEGAFANTNITSVTLPETLKAIPDYAFASSKITSIKIPAEVQSIGNHAFDSCSALAEVEFAGSAITETGDYAFANTALTSVRMPDGIKKMGSYTFFNCEQLEEATLPSVDTLGERTFEGCTALTTATFGANAKDSGAYTFFPGVERYDINRETQEIRTIYKESKLTTVNFGGLTEIGEAAFWYCKQLTNIDLSNVTVIGNAAFMECTALKTVTGLENFVDIGDSAFAGTGLTTLNLTNAKNIGEQAFYNVYATQITIPAAERIGNHAFANSRILTVNIPESLVSLGDGAFMSTLMTSVTVDDGNKVFFVKDNVLYRRITDFATGTAEKYELAMYPTNLNGTTENSIGNHYRVLDGTASIQSYAFAYAGTGLKAVTLPYSLKTIGVAAFYRSNVTRYNFEAINAPTLLSEFEPLKYGEMDYRTLYYANFREMFFDYFTGARQSDMTIGYPSNGFGYDSYVYNLYFSVKNDLGELIDDNTRNFNTLVDSFDLDTVKGWASLEVNDANTKTVSEFSEKVKEAHLAYNNIRSEKQFEFATEERHAKLGEIETALKPVKQRFNLPIKVSGVEVYSVENCKTQYVEGEKFDIKGLVVQVTYDDYSTELISDTSLLTILPEYTGALQTFDDYVELEYEGCYCRVPITVTAKDSGNTENPGQEENPPETPPQEGGNCAGCGTMDIGSTLGGTGLMLLATAGVLLLVQKLRRRVNKN